MTTLLTDGELTQLRADVLGVLVQTVAIWRASETVSAAGDAVKSFALSTSVAGRLDPMTRKSATSYMIGDQEKGRAYYQVTLVYNADLNDGDRVVVDGVTYDVLQIHEGVAAMAVLRALVVKRG